MAGIIIPWVQPYPNVVPDLALHLCSSALGHAIPGQAGISSMVCTPQPFSQPRHAMHLLNNPDRLRLHQKYKSNHRCDNLSYFTVANAQMVLCNKLCCTRSAPWLAEWSFATSTPHHMHEDELVH